MMSMQGALSPTHLPGGIEEDDPHAESDSALARMVRIALSRLARGHWAGICLRA